MKRARPCPHRLAAFTIPLSLPRVSSAHKSQLCYISNRPFRTVAQPTHRQVHSHPKICAAMASDDSPISQNLKDVNDKVISAVEKLSRQQRLTIPDISAAAGLDLNVAQDELVKLASLTGAAIDVTEDGQLAYRFPSNVRSILRSNSFRASVRMTWNRIFPVLFTAVRISFGALLILSIVVTFLAIAALAASSRSSDDDRSSSRSSSTTFFMPNRVFAPDIFDVMFYTRRRAMYTSVPREEMSFLEAVYSFVFGDGNPNESLEDRRWRKVAAIIRANRGAVTAEQLAPFLDLPESFKPSLTSTNIDESYVLPALQRFQGHPEVTDDGDIIYVFPSLSTTGSKFPNVELAGRGSGASEGAGPSLVEKEVEFSQADSSQRALTVGLGVVNVLGVVTLGSMIAGMTPVTSDAASLLAAVKSIYPALFAYAASFVFIPLMRFFRNRRINADIRARNQSRAAASMAIARPSRELERKLSASNLYAQKANVVQASDVVYSSDADILDQKSVQEDLTSEFDRRLEGL